jgi:hypothetical protein
MTIEKKNFSLTQMALVACAAVCVMLAFGRNVSDDVEDRITPAVEVINFGDIGLGVGRFDTSSGAIMAYNGDLRSPSGAGEWVREVAGVDSRASGTFRIQQAGTAFFLVDAAAGRTWILRQRAAAWRWEEVVPSKA